jgi:hypothetical protein
MLALPAGVIARSVGDEAIPQAVRMFKGIASLRSQ